MVITNQTGTTMSLRELWWDWNPKRLRKLISLRDDQIIANINLTSHYHREMLAMKESVTKSEQMLDLAHRELRVLRYELQAKEDAQNES